MPKKNLSKKDLPKLPGIKTKDKEELIEAHRRTSVEKMAAGRPKLGPSFDILTPIEEASREDDSESSRRTAQAESPRSETRFGEDSLEADAEESGRSQSAEPLATLAPIQEETREEAAEKPRRTLPLESKEKKVQIEYLTDPFESSESEKSSYTSEEEETTDDDSEEVSEDSEDEDSDDDDDDDSEDDETDEDTDDGETEDDIEDQERESDETEEEKIEKPKEEKGDDQKEDIETKYVPGPPLRGEELLKHVRELVRAAKKAEEEEEEKKKPKEPEPVLFDIVCRPDCSCKQKNKMAELQKTNVYRVLKLKECYSKHRNMSTEEFMAVTLPGMKLTWAEDFVTRRLFTHMIYHENFINTIVNNYYEYRDIRDTKDRWLVEVIFYLVLLRLKDATYKTVLKTVCVLGAPKGYNVVKYITLRDIPSSIQFHAYKFYGHQFVMKKVMKPLDLEKGVMPKLLRDIARCIESRKPKPTVSKAMKVLERSMKPSAFQQQEKQPEEQVLDYKPIPAKPAPMSTHEPPKTQRKLGKLKLQNKSEALKLLQEAQKHAFKCAAPKRLPQVKEPPSVHKIRAAPIPDFSKPPPVKKTTATVLREAARYMRDDIKATQLLKDLEAGGASIETYTLLQEEIRKRREQEELEAVERKHLQGLLTREEALLARHALLKERKERMKQFMLEHEEWERQLEELRTREEEKILALKSKTQGIEQGARERVQELQQKKRDKAQEVIRETRALLDQNIREREAELAQRMEMIREMRALHELKCLQNKEKEVDFTEPPGLGLMGEMSLAELHERLLLMRMELQDQENERRARIQEEKERMRSLIQNTEEYIQNIHNQKELLKKQKKKVSTAGEKRLDSPTLQKLRQRIEDARQQRIALAAATS